MSTREVIKKDLCLISNKTVKVKDCSDTWKVWKVEGEMCSCHQVGAVIGQEGLTVHFSELSIVQ